MRITSPTSFKVDGPAGPIAVHQRGYDAAPAVLMTHSIMAAGWMWNQQAELLANRGFRVICADTRGHGESPAPPGPYTMDDLVADSIAVLDALKIQRAHYVGLSLGGMSGFGLGIQHADRLLSLVLCDARADAPPPFLAPWPDRIATAKAQGCAALAAATVERWFGKPFMEANPSVASFFVENIAKTSVDGFIACAQALMKLDYLADVGRIKTPTTMVVGANDGPLPQAMRDLQPLIAGSVLEVIPNAGHLPNIDQAELFNAALLRHLDRVAA
jgi:3-oxoadipate enol-lactonase